MKKKIGTLFLLSALTFSPLTLHAADTNQQQEKGQEPEVDSVWGAFKYTGYHIKHGSVKAGHGIKTGGKAMGRGFKKAGHSIKKFFAGD
jgi:L-aminopeptidase/D-esterase-like protein